MHFHKCQYKSRNDEKMNLHLDLIKCNQPVNRRFCPNQLQPQKEPWQTFSCVVQIQNPHHTAYETLRMLCSVMIIWNITYALFSYDHMKHYVCSVQLWSYETLRMLCSVMIIWNITYALFSYDHIKHYVCSVQLWFCHFAQHFQFQRELL